MASDREKIIEQLRRVNDPELRQDIVTLDQVKEVSVDEGVVTVTIELLDATESMRRKVTADVRAVLAEVRIAGGMGEVEVVFTGGGSDVKDETGGEGRTAVAVPAAADEAGELQAESGKGAGGYVIEWESGGGAKHVIAVGAGKGGVGKSTVSVNLAVGLARKGYSVGLLDGDIYGPSLPTMLGLDEMDAETIGPKTIKPFVVHGIKAMTLGKLVEPDKALIWRGPMAHSAFRQLTMQTAWGELDYLIIDLPPGTGDVPLTMSQLLPLTGAVVVCTPQKVAQDDARRAVRMFESLNIPLLGVVENMSYFVGDDGKEYDLFGRGGASAMAEAMGLKTLASVPISMGLRERSDGGKPVENFEDEALTGELEKMVTGLIWAVAGVKGDEKPTLTIS